MRVVMVRYTVKPGRAQENEQLVRAVYAELAHSAPEGFRYATFKLEDGHTFVHLASVADGHENPLGSVAAFAEFQRGIPDRCEQGPVVSELSAVGDYRLLGGGLPA
ncbi:MAG TPA: hypothetical protein VN618_00220 [Solirubrobacteraceae bacterium]|nr:hypothetical protein [Solirubrobacteraceae bacterium]